MPERETKISRRDLFRLSGLLAAATVLESCGSPSPEPTPIETTPTAKPTEKPSPEPNPTPTTPPPPEPSPKPTVVVETTGFGGLDELTDAERSTATAFQEAYEQAARSQDLTGTVVLTRGDEEGEIGAFFKDNQDNPWSLVTREETQVLEQVPLYGGVQAKWVPNETRFEYLVDGKTFIYEPENSLLINEEGIVVSQWNGETTQWEEVPPPTPTPEPTETPEDTVYVTAQQITGYANPEGEEVGHIIPGQSFTILEEQDGWLKIRLEAGAEAWIQSSDTAYYPEGQVPPTPEPQPYPACEAPRFGGRTSDRKTGYNYQTGQYMQWINPEGNPISPHYRWFRRTHDSQWVTLRPGRILNIDSEKGVVSFDLGGGLVVKRRFVQTTQVIMVAHNVPSGTPQEQARPIGGNLCDLEVGDAAAILHPSEGEGANPSPEGPLWGVLIVQ